MELQIAELQASVQSKDQEISQVIQERDLLLEEITSLEDNLAWMLLARYRRLRDKLFPDETHRQRAYNAAKNSFKSLLRSGEKVTGLWNHSRSVPQVQSDQVSPQSPPETTARDQYIADSRSAPQVQSDQISPQSPRETTAQDQYIADSRSAPQVRSTKSLRSLLRRRQIKISISRTFSLDL